MAKTHRSRAGMFRAYWLAIVVFISAFMQGYDAGVAGGVLTFLGFQKDFGYENGSAKQTQVNSLSVGLQQTGAFLACPLIYPISDRYGRRFAIMLAAVVFVVGAILQVIDTKSLGAWYVARIIAGFGMGGYTVVTPTYSAEMAPKEIRGRMGSMYQMLYTIGIFTAYWTNYGVTRSYAGLTKEWQIPLSIEIVLGVLLFCGMLTLGESIRWLLERGRSQEAWKNLVWLRGDDGAETVREFEDMKEGIRLESEDRSDFKLKELLEPVNSKRIGIACALFLFQQGTGSGALATFGPQFFTLLVGNNGNTDLLLTGLFGAVKVVACGFFIIFLSERFGRRTFLVLGSLGMFLCMLPTSLVLHFKSPPPGVINSPAIATIALLYINIGFYNWSWGPIPWAYVPEIFPTRIRCLCVAIAVSTHWAFSVCFALATPYMIKNIKWGTFLFFAIFDMVNFIGSYFLVHETRGKTLEGVDYEFKHKIVDHEDVRVDAAEKHPKLPHLFSHGEHEDAQVDAKEKQHSVTKAESEVSADSVK